MATARVAAAQPATKPWRGEVVLEGLERGARAIDMAREWSERVVQEGARVRGAMAVRAAHARANENGAGDGVGRGDGERAGAGAGEAKNTAQKGGDTARGPVVVERGSVGYPEAAARRRVEGTVVVGVRVSGEGAVGRVWVSTTSGSKELDEAGMATVRAWRFSPAIGEDGLAVESEARVPVVFRLRRGE
jgi:TonB family protein